MNEQSCGRLEPAELQELRARLAHSAEAVALEIWGEPQIRTRREWRWGSNNGSLALEIRGRKRGLWLDRAEGVGGDLLKGLQGANGGNFRAALERACAITGYQPPSWDQTLTEEQRQRRERIAAADARRREIERARAAAKAKRTDEQDIARRIRVAQFIAGHAATIEVGSMFDRYLTETRGIPRPAAGWPDAVRYLEPWNNLPPAVALIATDANGRVAAVQKIEVKEAGGQVKKLRKITRGALAGTGAVVRLPGDAAGPLLIAEGPETGLSVWAATGHETWISVGGLSRLALLTGRRVIICRDDDADGSAADKALRRAIARWQLDGVDIAIAQPWAERRFDKTDFNDVIKAGGPAAVLEQIEAALYPALPAEYWRRVSIEEGRRQAKEAISSAFQRLRDGAADLTLAARCEVGIGKSVTARKEAAQMLVALRDMGDMRTVVFALPTHVLGDEAVQAFMNLPLVRQHGLVAAQWRGRTAKDPDDSDQRMCRMLDRVEAAQIAGADVEKSCCMRKLEDGTTVRCPLYDACAYQRQKLQVADVWFVAHETLFTTKPAAIGTVALVIIDESYWAAGLEGTDGKIELTAETLELAPSLSGLDGQRMRFLRHTAAEALREHGIGPFVRRRFLEAGLTHSATMEGYTLEWRLHEPPFLHPGMPDEAFKQAKDESEPNRTARRLARFWKALAALLADDGPERSGWLALGVARLKEGDVRMIRMKGRKTIKEGWQAPVLLIDATLQIDLVKPFFPAVELVADIAVHAPFQRVIQIQGRSNSKRRLLDDVHTSDRERRHRQRHREELAETVRKIDRCYDGRGLVISQQGVEDWLVEHGNLPGNIDLAHFNAIAGRDVWGPKRGSRGVDYLILVGRTMPKPADVEAIAEALSGRAVEPIDGPFPVVQTTREMAGGLAKAADGRRHPDPLCETIRAHICEAELLQALGRGRGLNRTRENPIDAYVLTDVPIPLPIDLVVPATALDPTATDRMLSAGGIAFESGVDAARVYPGIWRTESAAKSALKRSEKIDAFSTKFIRGRFVSNFYRVEFQLAGQGSKPKLAVVDIRQIPDAAGHLRRLFGELAAFRMIEEPAAPEPAVEAPQQRQQQPAEAPAGRELAPRVRPVPVLPQASPPKPLPSWQPALSADDVETVEFWDDHEFFQPTWMMPPGAASPVSR